MNQAELELELESLKLTLQAAVDEIEVLRTECNMLRQALGVLPSQEIEAVATTELLYDAVVVKSHCGRPNCARCAAERNARNVSST